MNRHEPAMNRRGALLVEVLVALLLSTLVLAMFAHSLIGQRQAERTIAKAGQPSAAAGDAVQVLASALSRVSSADSLWVRGDTALEWRTPIGVAVACLAGADTVVVPDTGAGAWWEVWPVGGDAVDLGAADGSWSRHEVVAVRSRAAGGACGGAQHTLQIRPPPAEQVQPLVQPLVRVTRRARFMLYRGGDGAWWLGERPCDEATPVQCSSAQPVAGPLAPAPEGLRFAIDTTQASALITITARSGNALRAAVVAIRP